MKINGKSLEHQNIYIVFEVSEDQGTKSIIVRKRTHNLVVDPDCGEQTVAVSPTVLAIVSPNVGGRVSAGRLTLASLSQNESLWSIRHLWSACTRCISRAVGCSTTESDIPCA